MHQVYQLHAPFVLLFLLFAAGFALAHVAGERR
jgi:hypothetical protein